MHVNKNKTHRFPLGIVEADAVPLLLRLRLGERRLAAGSGGAGELHPRVAFDGLGGEQFDHFVSHLQVDVGSRSRTIRGWGGLRERGRTFTDITER